MSREEALRALLEQPATDAEQSERIARIEQKLDLILSVIAIPQQLAADVSGVHRDTIINKAKKGELEVLQKDGSSLNFVTLKQASELKPRRSAKK